MAADAGIFQQYLNPVRSVADYRGDMDKQEQNALTLAGARMTNQTAQQGMADDQAARQAFMDSGGDSSKALNALQAAGLYKHAQALQKSMLDTQKVQVDTGLAKARTGESDQNAASKRSAAIGQTLGSLSQIEGGATPQHVTNAMQHLVDIGQISPEMAQKVVAGVPADPAKMKGWLLQGQSALLPVKDQLPKFEKTDIGGNVATGTVDPVSGAYTPGTALQKTQTPDSVESQKTIRRGQDMADARAIAKDGGMSGHGGAVGVDPTSPETTAIVQAIIDGRKALTPAEMKSSYGQDLLKMVAQKDPSFDMVNFASRAKTRADFTAGKSAENIKALNTAISHIGQLNDQMTALNNGNSAAYNTVANWAGSNLGLNKDLQGRLASVDTTAEGVAGEMAKVFRSVGMSEGEINAWRKKFNTNATPGAQQGTMQSAMHMLDGRLQAIGDQYQKGMGITAQPLQMLTPQSQVTFDKLSGNKTASPQDRVREAVNNGASANLANSRPPSVSNAADYAKLPSGAVFTAPDGSMRTKK